MTRCGLACTRQDRWDTLATQPVGAVVPSGGPTCGRVMHEGHALDGLVAPQLHLASGGVDTGHVVHLRAGSGQALGLQACMLPYMIQSCPDRMLYLYL